MSQEFLSIRTDVTRKARLKALAVERRTSVRALVEGAVDDLLAGRQGDRLATVIRTLRAHEAELRAAGIGRLWVFGSVARGEAGPDSDVDLLAEPAAGVALSYLRLAAWQEALERVLGYAADVTTPDLLKPHVREAALADRLEVFRAT